MLRNQLISAYRNFIKRKLLGFISLFGFVISLVSLMLIMLHVREEIGYDHHHSQSDRIFRITADTSAPTFQNHASNAGFMVAESLLEFPEVEHVTRLWNDYSRPISVVHNNQKFIENRVHFVEPSFFDVFDVEMLRGDGKQALSDKNGLIISEETAEKYFKDEDPIGKVFTIVSNESDGDFIVRGVAKRFPKKSHFNFDFLVPLESFEMWWKRRYTLEIVATYTVLREGTNLDSFKERLQAIVPSKMTAEIERFAELTYDEYINAGYFYRLNAQALTDIYLHSDFDYEIEPLGNYEELSMIALIGLFILILAIINYINLSTAGASMRIKEIGVRSVLGARRKELTKGFLLESLLLSLVGLIIAFGLVLVFLPVFNDFTGHSLVLKDLMAFNSISVFVGLGIALGLISGIYPSLILARISSVGALKGRTGLKERGVLRNFLVLIQFSVSLFLITASLVVAQQLRYVQNKKLGFDQSRVITIDRSMADLSKLNQFKTTIQGLASIESASITSSIGARSLRMSTTFSTSKNSGDKFDLNLIKADEDYLKTLGLNLEAGRWFSREFKSDSMSLVLNQKAVALLGLENPVGTILHGWLPFAHKIIGVVDDFHFESLHNDIEPLIILSADLPHPVPFISHLLVRTSPGSGLSESLVSLKKSWDSAVPDRPFQFKFLDQHLNGLYEKEQKTAGLVKLFTTVAIFIAVLGLFGLITFVVDRKLKEIGIRKVLGARLSGLYALMVSSISKPVLLALVLTTPLSVSLMNQWLHEFAFRIELGFKIPLIATLVLCTLVILTISQTIVKAARQNPSTILRDE